MEYVLSISKAWDWSKEKNEIWEMPSEDSYFLLNRWKGKGFHKFLDLGCGLGRHSFQFAHEGFSVSALDLSELAIQHIKEISERENLDINAQLGDMLSLPYDDETFDCILAFHAISHTDTNGMRKIVKELERVLRPGGEIYVTLCSKMTWSYRDAGFPIVDENSVMKIEDGAENGIPHFFADEEIVKGLFLKFSFVRLRHIQDLVIEDQKYVSWHYFLLGQKDKAEGN